MFDTNVEVVNQDLHGYDRLQEHKKANQLGRSSLSVQKEALALDKKQEITLTLDMQETIKNLIDEAEAELSKHQGTYKLQDLRSGSLYRFRSLLEQGVGIYSSGSCHDNMQLLGEEVNRITSKVSSKLEVSKLDILWNCYGQYPVIQYVLSEDIEWLKSTFPYSGIFETKVKLDNSGIEQISRILREGKVLRSRVVGMLPDYDHTKCIHFDI